MAKKLEKKTNLIMALCHIKKLFIFFELQSEGYGWNNEGVCGWNNTVPEFALKYFRKENAREDKEEEEG